MFALLWRIDSACHWLQRWHLLPRFAFRPLCDWCDRQLMAAEGPGIDEKAAREFFEEDEPEADVLAAFERGEKHLTSPPGDEFDEFEVTEAEWDRAWAAGEPVALVTPKGFRCIHMGAFIGGDAHFVGRPEFGCGCDPMPVFQ